MRLLFHLINFFEIPYGYKSAVSIWSLSENRKKLMLLFTTCFVIPLFSYIFLYFLNNKLIEINRAIKVTEYFAFPKLVEFYGVYIGLCALFIGLIVMLKIVGNVANNSDEFIPMLIDILKKADNSDEIIMIFPTIMIEKKRSPSHYKAYKKMLIDKLNAGIKINFCFLSTVLFEQYSRLNAASANAKDKFLEDNSNDPLISFHLNFISSDFCDPDGLAARINSFDDLVSFYHDLENNNNFKYTPLSDKYLENKFIAIVNKTKGTYSIGAFKIKNHNTLGKIFDYSATKFEYDSTNEIFNKFLNQTIGELQRQV